MSKRSENLFKKNERSWHIHMELGEILVIGNSKRVK